jgi:uncharacterized protein YutE (UPF0331/DUF86 family)
MTVVQEARQILELLTPQLEAEGYTVYLEPPRQLLPGFMQGYTPDAIALPARNLKEARKKLAIEVAIEGSSASLKEDILKQRFMNAKDWELRVYYARPNETRASLPAMSREAIDTSLASIASLISTDQLQAALLLAWATFEALGRAVAGGKLARAQSPGRLIEVLASDGLVTPSEADTLRGLSKARNQLIHGRLDADIQRADLLKFIEILTSLRSLMDSPASA